MAELDYKLKVAKQTIERAMLETRQASCGTSYARCEVQYQFICQKTKITDVACRISKLKWLTDGTETASR